jgi:hypothetical protein
VKLTVEISNELIDSLLYDHGTWGWMHEAVGHWRREGIVCKYDDPDSDNVLTFVVAASDVQRGLQIMAEKYPRQWAAFMADSADRGTADILYQCMIFGQEIYA